MSRDEARALAGLLWAILRPMCLGALAAYGLFALMLGLGFEPRPWHLVPLVALFALAAIRLGIGLARP